MHLTQLIFLSALTFFVAEAQSLPFVPKEIGGTWQMKASKCVGSEKSVLSEGWVSMNLRFTPSDDDLSGGTLDWAGESDLNGNYCTTTDRFSYQINGRALTLKNGARFQVVCLKATQRGTRCEPPSHGTGPRQKSKMSTYNSKHDKYVCPAPVAMAAYDLDELLKRFDLTFDLTEVPQQGKDLHIFWPFPSNSECADNALLDTVWERIGDF